MLFWGTYDLSKPRNRILRDGLRAAGAAVTECHSSIWERVRDKSVLDRWSTFRHLARAVVVYPQLLLRFMREPAPDVVLVGYLGQLDVLLIRPWARLRGVPVVWDQFISLYNTVVEDRHQVSARHPLAAALYAWEWLGCRAADRVLMDTDAHGSYVAERFGVPRERVLTTWVGAETASFPPVEPAVRPEGERFTVLFYGQFIPLHGIDTIVRAARLLRDEPVRFVIIGSGQEESKIRELLDQIELPDLEWIRWVEYEELVTWLGQADVCLGIFGDTDKAARVIPNKVFQIVAAGRPLITRDSPAIRELFGDGEPGVQLVPPADPEALAAAVLRQMHAPVSEPILYDSVRQRISPEAIGRQVLAVLRESLKLALPEDG